MKIDKKDIANAGVIASIIAIGMDMDPNVGDDIGEIGLQLEEIAKGESEIDVIELEGIYKDLLRLAKEEKEAAANERDFLLEPAPMQEAVCNGIIVGAYRALELMIYRVQKAESDARLRKQSAARKAAKKEKSK